MNPAQLLRQFDRISEAPDAIARMRRFILDLAVRGKLVEQDPRDEPGSELFKRIQAEKLRLVKEGIFREQKPLPPIEEDETNYVLPASWEWVRMGDVIKLWNGYAFKSGDFQSNGIPVIRIGDLQGGKVALDGAVRISEAIGDAVGPEFNIPNGALLIAMSGATTGKVAFNRTDVRLLLNQRVGRIEVFMMNPDFIRFFFDTIVAKNLSISLGTAIPNLSAQQINKTIVPLPPLAEQHRIVAKVDELMALCDRVETAQTERESRRDRLVASSLHHLNNGAGADAFREHARFYFNHLPRLTTRPDHIKQLRQTILNLAVRGKLSPNSIWPPLPKSLGEAALLQNGYAFKSEWFTSTGIRLLRNANVSHGFLRWDDSACLPRKRAAEFDRFQLKDGDVVLSLDRPFIVTGTKVACVRPQDLPCLLLQRVGRFQLNVGHISPEYLFLWLHSPHFTGQINPGRSNGVPHISSKQVEAAEIFLPPLAEQHRIVAKVDELMALCGQLETQLTTTQSETQELMEAILHEALNPTLEKIA